MVGLIDRSSNISFLNLSVQIVHKVSLNPDFLFSKFSLSNFSGNDGACTHWWFNVFQRVSRWKKWLAQFSGAHGDGWRARKRYGFSITRRFCGFPDGGYCWYRRVASCCYAKTTRRWEVALVRSRLRGSVSCRGIQGRDVWVRGLARLEYELQ